MKFFVVAVTVLWCVLHSLGTHALSSSKISIHTSMSGANSHNVVFQGKPKLIKLLDSFGQAAQIKKSLPGVVIVGRIYLAQQPTNGSPQQAAQAWWGKVKSTILQYPAVDYWEGYNEPPCGNVQQMKWIAAFEIERVNILASHNLKASIGQFPTGNPNVADAATIAAWVPAVENAQKHGGVFGLHEYSSPFVNTSFSGAPCTGSGWLTGRYRKLYPMMRKAGMTHDIPLVVSEFGIDGGTCGNTGCNFSGGWKNDCTKYWNPTGIKNCNAQYMSGIEWYDRVMSCDSFVIGATIFSLDISGWNTFDVGPLTPLLVKYLQSKQ
eukprot:TRINITY_DN3332_c0_g1_i1.p1 TRINITY_DN3332_c0_g1~~TRINITY_DN3332_c0_g1_i1.p1  ORF type:complete len:322 (-),score=23.52 TRINITY_DN3332_c0_g1_i1:81-1046(-)